MKINKNKKRGIDEIWKHKVIMHTCTRRRQNKEPRPKLLRQVFLMWGFV